MRPESYIDLFSQSVLSSIDFELHNDELKNWAKTNLAYINKYAEKKYKETDSWATMSSDYAPGEEASNFVYDVLLPAYEDGTLNELVESKQYSKNLMSLTEAKQILKNHGYIVKEGAFGDWAKRTFQGETLLGQEMNRMDDKLANHFAGLISLQMSRAAAKLKNDKYFVNDLIQRCNRLARQFRSAAKSDDNMVSGTFQLQSMLATSFYNIIEALEQYDSRININSKVFDSNVPDAECKNIAKEYGKG